MINSISNICPTNIYPKSNCSTNTCQQNSVKQYSPNFEGSVSRTMLVAQKSSHTCEIGSRKFINFVASLFNRKFVNSANEVLSQIERIAPEYIFAIAGAGRIFAQNREVEINSEDGIIEKLAAAGKPHIFIMNHDNQKADPLMLGFFNTMLNEEYVVTEQAETCPRPRIILNEDILLTMRPKMKNIFEKLGSIGIDASLSGGNKAANGRKMVQIMKEYVNGESNIYIFPEGKNCAFKDKPLNERFQPGIAKLIERLISKTDVSVVPLGFAYNKSDKNLSAIQIGEPILFEKGSNKDKDTILNTICGALEDAVNTAKEKVPQKTLGDKVVYV